MEHAGAERFDPERTDHVDLVRRIVASHRSNADASTDADYQTFWRRPEAEIFRDMKGAVLVETLPEDRRKYLASLHSPFAPMVGVESFRGKRIEHCQLLPTMLRQKAYQEIDASEMAEYAEELEAHIPEDEQLGFSYCEIKRKVDEQDPSESIDHRVPRLFWEVEALKEAVGWLRFWSQFPVRMCPWC